MKTDNLDSAARIYVAECERLGIDAPACMLPTNTTDDLTESKEEREAFELLERNQQITAMVAIARECPTTSLTGICTRLFEAGCRIEVRHG